MPTLRIDSVGGASGDMLLGALTSIGADPKLISEQLSEVVSDSFEIRTEPTDSHGIHGIRATVIINGEVADQVPEKDSGHDHGHSHHHHEHEHEHNHKHHHEHHEHPPNARGEDAEQQAANREHRHHVTLPVISARLNSSNLPKEVIAGALDTFKRIAIAEAEIHGSTPDEVHFHEVGATDAIIDIVGCHIALHQLGIDAVRVGPLPLGQGIMRCAHGTMPLPAPATLKILKGHSIIQTEEPFELVTPTGAALLMSFKNISDPPAKGRVGRCGTGFGHRTLKQRPNMIRLSLIETDEETGSHPDDCTLLEANIDDSTPEWLGALLPRLIEAGALDAWLSAITMKKGRPANCLSVLCTDEDRTAIEQLIFHETTTFGIRRHSMQRSTLDRHFHTVATPYGEIPIKVGILNGIAVTQSPEHDACAAAATKHNVSVREVWSAASASARKEQ